MYVKGKLESDGNDIFIMIPTTYHDIMVKSHEKFVFASILLIHYIKSVCAWSYLGLCFPAFGLNTDQNNSEYGHFLYSDSALLFCGRVFSCNSLFYENLTILNGVRDRKFDL